MRTYNWKPGTIKKMEPILDDQGAETFEEDGVTPKLKMIDADSPFEGHVIVKVCKYTERLKLMKACNIGKKDQDIDQVALIEAGIKHISKVELVRKSDGKSFNTVDELEYDKDGADVINSIANEVIGGVQLGENLGQN